MTTGKDDMMERQKHSFEEISEPMKQEDENIMEIEIPERNIATITPIIKICKEKCRNMDVERKQ